MNGAEFIRRIRKLGRERGVLVRFEARHGKDRKKEIRQGLLHAMLNQLGSTIRDIE